MAESCAIFVDDFGDVQAADRQNAEGSHDTSGGSSEESSEESPEKSGKKRAPANAIPDKRVGTTVLCAVVMYSRRAVSQNFAQRISAHRAGQFCQADTRRRQEEKHRGD